MKNSYYNIEKIKKLKKITNFKMQKRGSGKLKVKRELKEQKFKKYFKREIKYKNGKYIIK